MLTPDDAPCGLIAFGDDGNVVDVNAALLDELGYRRDELVGRPFEQVLPASGRIFVLTHLRPLLQLHGRVAEVYFALRKRDGAELPVLANAERRDRDGRPLNVCATLTIRRRGEFEQRLVAARRGAEEALRARAELLALKEAQYAELERMAGRLRELAARTDAQREATSRAAARSLHERVAQEIAALKLGLEAVRRATDAEPLQQTVERLTAIAAQSLTQVRELSYELYPPALEHADLPSALRAAVRDFEAVHGLHTRLQCGADLPRTDRDTKLVLYRFVEEALGNAARHGAPSRIDVDVACEHGTLSVRVADDGTGADADALERAGVVGLLATRERLRHLGGELTIDSAPGRGFAVTASLAPRAA